MIIFDRLLRHVSEHCVGATKRDHCHLAKEQSDATEHVVPAERVYQRGYWTEPQHPTDDGDFDRACPRRTDVVRDLFGERPIDRCRLIVLAFSLSMTERSAEGFEARGMSDKADKRRSQDDQRKRCVKKEDRDVA